MIPYAYEMTRLVRVIFGLSEKHLHIFIKLCIVMSYKHA